MPSDSDVPRLSVIVVSYNTRELTLRCLERVTTELRGHSTEILVVDNASTDGSAQPICERFGQVTLIGCEKNVGFGAANNIAMRGASGMYFLLLNSDAFLMPGSIDAMLRSIESDSKIGIVGPRLMNADGTLQVSCFPFPSPARAWLENLGVARLSKPASRWGDYRRWTHDRVLDVAWAVGACLLVRREVYDQIGGFDERFFMYAEETDWQRRVRDAGWRIVFTPEAQVTHLGGASGASDRPRINEHFFQSLDRYTMKHHGRLGLLSLRLAMCVGCSARAVGWLGLAMLHLGRDVRAIQRARLHAWLTLRQMFSWKAAVH